MEAVFLIILILSIIFHEIAHGAVANAFGDPTAKLAGRLTLNPIKHIDPIGSIIVPAFLILTGSSIFFGWAKPVPYNPYNLPSRFAEALVAGAGVLLNFFLAFIFAMFLRFVEITSDPIMHIFIVIVLINLFLAFLNLIPFPPLDGAKIFLNIVPKRFGARVGAFVASSQAQLGFWGSMALVFVFLLLIINPLSSFTYWTFSTLTGLDLSVLTTLG